MKISRNLRLGAISIAVIAAAGYLYFHTNTQSPSARVSLKSAAAEALFQSSFNDLSGTKQPLAQWQGKILVVNLWATWCPPCLAEIPEFIQLQKQYGKQGVQFIGIAIDQPGKVKVYAEEAGMNYPVLLGEQEGIDLSRRMGNTQGGLPYTAIIDRNGNIVATQLGALSKEKLENLIRLQL